jgi:osmotically-inducible protein OsmY
MKTKSATLASTRPSARAIAGSPEENYGLSTRIADLARQRLGGTSYQFLRFVDCCFQNGVLTLRGRVPSFYLKQMAQSLLANIEGVDRIDNRVDVVSPRGLSSVR